MSTKIFTGHRILLGSESLLSFARKTRQALEPVYLRLYGQLVTNLAVTLADARLLGEDPQSILAHDSTPARLDQSPFLVATNILDAAKYHIDASRRRNPALDLDCEIAFFDDPNDRIFVYAIISTERDEYIEAFRDLPGTEAHPYWNNTDRPGDVSAEEWDERRETWDRVISDTNAGPRGLTLNLLGGIHFAYLNFMPHPERIEEFIPDRDTRARRIAQRRAYVQMDKDRPKSADVLSTSGVMHLLANERPAREALEDEITAQVEPQLAEITVEDLRHFAPLLERLELSTWPSAE